MTSPEINTNHVIDVLESLVDTIISMDALNSETQEIKQAFVKKAFVLEYTQRVELRENIITVAKNASGKEKMQAYELASSLYNTNVEYEIIS